MRRTLYGANKDERLAARYIPSGARRVLAKADGVSAAYIYDTARGSFGVIAYRGTAGRSEFHYTYRTAAARDAKVASFIASIKANQDYRAKVKADRKSDVCTLVPGDIVNTSWGYDQTNVDFYVVTRVTKYRAVVRKVAGDYEATGFMCGKTWPAMPLTIIGPEIMCHANGKNCLIDGHSAGLTTGDTYTSSYA